MPIKSTIEQNRKTLPNTELLETIRRTLPQYFDKDGNFKMDKFESELKENNISEARDGYRLNFVGKDYARLQTGQSSETLIVPDIEHNSKLENAKSENVFITGDNLEALRHLQNAYSGQIKMIYIDPPYNTGKEFVYNDRFEFDDQRLSTALGYTEKEINRLKSIQGKSSHSAWLTFMYPRLKLAQKLLTDDGIIFVSIDDNEQANLKLLLDDIFGEGNFVATVPRIAKRTSDKGTHFRPTKDYLHVWAKNINSLAEFGVEKKINESDYNLEEKDGRKYKQSGASLYQPSLDSRPNQRYYIQAPDGSLIIPPGTVFPDEKKDGSKVIPISNADKVWRWSLETYEKQKDLLIFTKGSSQNPLLDENGLRSKWNVYPKVYLDDDMNSSLHPEDIIYDFPNSQGTKEIISLSIPFSFAKPIGLLKYLFKLIRGDDYIVLDFFAGSSSTAHAVMELNSEDNGNRSFIMVQWAEPTNPDSEANKAGFRTIDVLSRERIVRAAIKIKKSNPFFADSLDLGFKHYRLIQPEVDTIDKIIDFNPTIPALFDADMLKYFDYPETKTSGIDTILQTWLIQDGYNFNTTIDHIELDGYIAYYNKNGLTLYLINRGFEMKALKSLLNKIGKSELIINTINVFPYSFSFEHMRELKYNLKTIFDQSQNKNIVIRERY